MKQRKKSLIAGVLIAAMVLGVIPAALADEPVELAAAGGSDEIEWVVKYEENFDEQVDAPDTWKVDTYEDEPDTYFGDKGIGIQQLIKSNGGNVDNFLNAWDDFTAYRQSYTFGQDDWLTVESYTRGEENAQPEEGGRWIMNGDGKAVMVVKKHTDATLIASSKPLPSTYRLEVTVQNIDVGGLNVDENGKEVPMQGNSWAPWTEAENTNPYVTDYEGPRVNGYFCDTNANLSAGPVHSGTNALSQNGMYFLSIVDYGVPRPHNNTFIHHHRKVAFDTDNNGPTPWSYVYTDDGEKKLDGSRYISMLWLEDRYQGAWINSGSVFYSYTNQDKPEEGAVMLDKYIPGESYTFAVERTPESYTMEVSGKFYYGGETTYRHTKMHLPDDDNFNAATYHFNQTLEELQNWTPNMSTMQVMEQDYEPWPETAVYPDYFYLGIPHTNFYAGTAEFTNITLKVPAGSADDPAMAATTVEIDGIEVADKVYDGKAIVPETEELAITYLDADKTDLTAKLADLVTYTYYSADDPDHALSITPKAAGDYVLKVGVNTRLADNTLCVGRKSIPFTIEKATVTITANDAQITAGTAEPEYTYKVTGLVEGERLAHAPTMTAKNLDLSKAGTYSIIPSGAALTSKVAANYNDIVYVAGKLTVKGAQSSGGGNRQPSGGSGGSAGTPATTPATSAQVNTTVDAAGNTVVTLPQGTSKASVTVPVQNVTPGTVAVLVDANGNETIIRKSVVTDKGVTMELNGSSTVKFKDNTTNFSDVSQGHWASDAVAYVSSHELFQGVGGNTFEPTGTMTRAMLITVLARLDGAETEGGATWYEKGASWAVAKGVSNGENLDADITRAELAMMLFRYAGKPTTKGDLKGFADAASVSAGNVTPLAWAVEKGIINGKDGKILDPDGVASRAEVAAMLERFVKAIL